MKSCHACDDVTAAGEPARLAAQAMLASCIQKAVHALEAHISEYDQSLPHQSIAPLRDSLERRLVEICLPSLRVEFSALATARNLTGGDAATVPRDFLLKMDEGGWVNLRQRLPEMERLLELARKQWHESTAEFFGRFRRDQPDLVRIMFSSAEPVSLASWTPALSDPHHNGRTVICLNFSTGAHLIYKPRSLQPEMAFREILQWINSAGFSPQLRAANVFNRGDYGWMEYVSPQPCTSVADVRMFYSRAGALLCLIHLLRGVDFHRDNLIACGSHPIFFDLETLLHPAANDDPIGESILRTGFLPGGSITPNTAYRISALAALPSPHPHENLPKLGDCEAGAADFVDEIKNGFLTLGRFLLTDSSRKSELQKRLIELGRSHRRQILRPTVAYEEIIHRSLHPAFLSSRAGRMCEIARRLASCSLPPNVIENEAAALERLDIPIFQAAMLPGTGLLPDFSELESEAVFIGQTLGHTYKDCQESRFPVTGK